MRAYLRRFEHIFHAFEAIPYDDRGMIENSGYPLFPGEVRFCTSAMTSAYSV